MKKMFRNVAGVAFATAALMTTSFASAAPIEFDFADIMNGEGGGSYVADLNGGGTFASVGEAAAVAAKFTKSGLTVTFTAGGDDLVMLDKNPFKKTADHPGSGIGVCTPGEKCIKGPADEISISSKSGVRQVLFASFEKTTRLSNFLFAQENNMPLIADSVAANLVEIQVRGTRMDYAEGGVYTGTKFGFRIQDDIFGSLGLDNGNEYYLHGWDASVVPLPGAAWLFGSALMVLAGVNSRKRAVRARA